MSCYRSLLILIAAFVYCAEASAQAYLSPGGPKGGGSFSDCDSSLLVDFEVTPLGNSVQEFAAVIEPGNTAVLQSMWTYYDQEIVQLYGEAVQASFSGPGEYPVCLTVSAFDLVNSQNCYATVCRFEELVQHPSCLSYEPDFTIGSVDGYTISFEDVSPFGGDSIEIFWNYGDGSAATSAGSFTFTGPGPHEVCMTIVGPEPENCTATICKWLYLGPGDVPCDEVLQPGFIHYQNENFVVVLDTSLTTGQSNTTHWDFGDGATATGRVAVHAYGVPFGGDYEVCATVDLWGPLVNDTCETTVCEVVFIGALTTIDEPFEVSKLSLFPVPATEVLWVNGLNAGQVGVQVCDALGRIVLDQEITNSTEGFPLAIKDLSTGLYMLRCAQDGSLYTGRFLKE